VPMVYTYIMNMKINNPMVLQIVASILFLIGAVFMLVNTFNEAMWSFWTGLVFALVGTAFYIYMVYLNRRDNTNNHGTTKTTNNDTNSVASSAASSDSEGFREKK